MRLAVLLAVPLLAGCVGQDEVVFVTNTNVGINFDTKPPVLNIGYDREEGYIGPIHANGALPPVLARLESNLSIITPRIEQTYATGQAAVNLTLPPGETAQYPMRSNRRRVAYALTSQAVGLNVAFASNGPVPESVHLGYKRKELSLIPLADAASSGCQAAARAQEQDTVCYGSVLAQIKLDTSITDATGTAMKLNQMFATGVAAENLAAADPATRARFGAELNFKPIEFACDEACRALQAIRAKPGFDRARFMKDCVKPSGAAVPSEFYFDPRFAPNRQACVQAFAT